MADYPIDYCLIHEIDEKCMLQFSVPIMLIVIICNVIKTVCMIQALLRGGLQPLVIVGDAIASFLNEPDPATKNICMADKYFFRKESWQARIVTQSKRKRHRWFQDARILTWKPKRHRWLRAASKTRWLVCNVL